MLAANKETEPTPDLKKEDEMISIFKDPRGWGEGMFGKKWNFILVLSAIIFMGAVGVFKTWTALKRFDWPVFTLTWSAALFLYASKRLYEELKKYQK